MQFEFAMPALPKSNIRNSIILAEFQKASRKFGESHISVLDLIYIFTQHGLCINDVLKAFSSFQSSHPSQVTLDYQSFIDWLYSPSHSNVEDAVKICGVADASHSTDTANSTASIAAETVKEEPQCIQKEEAHADQDTSNTPTESCSLSRAKSEGVLCCAHRFGNAEELMQIHRHPSLAEVCTMRLGSCTWKDHEYKITSMFGGAGPGHQAYQLASPVGISVVKGGGLLIADTWNHRIQSVHKGDLEARTAAGGKGRGVLAMQLASPCGIAMTRDGGFLIADTDNHRIQYIPNGSFDGITVAGAAGRGTKPWHLNSPRSVLATFEGCIVVVDTGNHRIQCFPRNAYDAQTLAGGKGRGGAADQLDSPHDAAFAGDGGLLVADTWNHRIQYFRPGVSEGVTLAGGAGKGSSCEQLSSPQGVALAADGGLLVADTGNHRIQYFAKGQRQGTTLAGHAGEYCFQNKLRSPCRALPFEDGKVVVADTGNHRIVIIHKSGLFFM